MSWWNVGTLAMFEPSHINHQNLNPIWVLERFLYYLQGNGVAYAHSNVAIDHINVCGFKISLLMPMQLEWLDIMGICWSNNYSKQDSHAYKSLFIKIKEKEGLDIPDSIMKGMPNVARSRGCGVEGGDSSLQLVRSLLDP